MDFKLNHQWISASFMLAVIQAESMGWLVIKHVKIIPSRFLGVCEK